MEAGLYWACGAVSVLMIGLLLAKRRRFTEMSEPAQNLLVGAGIAYCVALSCIMLFVPY